MLKNQGTATVRHKAKSAQEDRAGPQNPEQDHALKAVRQEDTSSEALQALSRLAKVPRTWIDWMTFF